MLIDCSRFLMTRPKDFFRFCLYSNSQQEFNTFRDNSLKPLLKAVELYERARALDEKEPDVMRSSCLYYNIGRALACLERFGDAVKVFDECKTVENNYRNPGMKEEEKYSRVSIPGDAYCVRTSSKTASSGN